MAHARDIERIALAEVRLLREAQHGNPAALTSLIEPHLAGLWSICRAQLGPDSGRVALLSFRQRLTHAIREFVLEDPFGVQLYGLLWTHLSKEVEPSGGLSIVEAQSLGRTPDTSREGFDTVNRVLKEQDPFDRLLWLFSSVTGVDAPGLSSLTGVAEPQVRDSRTRVLLALHHAMTR